jgi:hypothetical protein
LTRQNLPARQQKPAVPVVTDEALSRLEVAQGELQSLALRHMEGNMAEALMLATAIEAVELALTPQILQRIAALQGKRIGYNTDRAAKGGRYRPEELQGFAVEVIANGGRFVGGEVMCFNGNAYFHAPFYERRLRELTKELGEPVIQPAKRDRATLVFEAEVSWALPTGEVDSFKGEFRLPEDRNRNVNFDTMAGKVRRRLMRAALLKVLQVDANKFPDAGDFEEGAVHEPPPSAEGMAQPGESLFK